MKKSLAILMSVILLFSSLVCGMVLTTSADDVSSLPSDLFIDLTTEEGYNTFVNSAKTNTNDGFFNLAHSWDTDGVKMVIGKTNGAQVRLGCHGGYEVSATDYPILAMKVKVTPYTANAGTRTQGPWFWANNPGAAAVYHNNTNSYDLTKTDWQLVTFDMSSAASANSGTWKRIHIYLDELAGTVDGNKTMSMQWAGYFKSAAEAQTFFDGYTGPTGDEVDVESLKSDLFVDFTTEALYNASGAQFYNTTSAVYDTDAVKITWAKVNGAQLQYGMSGSVATVPVAEYKAFAMKVKLGEGSVYTPAAKPTWKGPWFWQLNTGIGACDYNINATAENAYDLTSTDWQLVVLDLSKVTATGDAWKQIQLYFDQIGNMSDNTKTMWIQWAGYFKNADEAQTFFDGYTGPTGGGDNTGSGDGGNTGEGGNTGDSGDDAEEEEAFMYWDYTTEANFNALTSVKDTEAGNASLSYDNGAMKITPASTAAATLWLRSNRVKQVALEDYKFFAIKIKTPANAMAWNMYTYSTTGNGSGVPMKEAAVPAYNGTTDWQLQVFEITTENLNNTASIGQTGNWSQFGIYLDQKWKTNGDAPFYVEWAGLFKTKAEAEAYYADYEGGTDISGDIGGGSGDEDDDTTPEKPGIHDDGETYENTFYMDFSTKEKYDALVASNSVSGNQEATLSWDAENQALKIVDNGSQSVAPTVSFGFDDIHKGDRKRDVVLAIKIRRDSVQSRFWACYTYASAGNTSNVGISSIPTYKRNTEWQVLLLDISHENLNYTVDTLQEGPWRGFLLYLDEMYKTHDTPMYIQSIGLFESKEAANEFYGVEEDEGYDASGEPSEWFLNFATKQSFEELAYGAVIPGNEATIEFDEATSSMKVLTGIDPSTKQNKAPIITFGADRARRVPVADYPVFAFKVKLGDPMNSRLWACYSYASGGYTGNVSVSAMPTYQNSDEWQLVTINLAADAKVKGQTGDWLQFLVYIDELYRSHNMPYYIQWAGLFKNTEDAQAYFDKTTETQGGEEDEGPDGSEDTIPAPTEVFWDLSSKKVIKNQVEVAGDTAVSFDTDMDAMKVLATDTNGDGAVGITPGRFSLGTKVPLSGSFATEEYPYIAMRVRLNNANLMGGNLYVRSTGTIQNFQDGMLSSANLQVDVLDYDATTDWQTIVIYYKDNTTADFFFSGDWMSMMLNMFGTAAMDGDTVWMRWAGAFKSEADITSYVAATKHQEKTISVSGGQTSGNTGNADDAGSTGADTETSPDTGDTNAVLYALVALLPAAAGVTLLRRRVRKVQTDK